MPNINSHIIFLHLPKAGGMTFRSFLRKQYQGQGIFEIGVDVMQQIRQFREMDIQDREGIKLLMGHMSHGLHQYFISSATYLTMLRNPVERVFSEYRFLSSNRHHELYEVIHGLSFQEYLDLDPTRQGSNGQTRLLSGIAYKEETGVPDVRPLKDSDYDKAAGNLEKYYPMVGILERYDESLMLWRQKLNWRYPFYEKKNITEETVLKLSEQDIVTAKKRNQHDMALYRLAENMLETEIKKQPFLFKKQLSLFRILNRFYQRLAVFRKKYGL